jgi:hypothetical protein
MAILSFWGLAKRGRSYERNRHFFGSSDCAFCYLAAPADASAETTDRRVRITTDVPGLRIDHVSAKGKLLGVWQALYSGGVFDFKEMIRRFAHVSPELFCLRT